MKKTKSKDDKRDKFECSKCGHPCGNKGGLKKHKGSEACKRRQRKQKTLNDAQPKKKKHVKRTARKRSKSQQNKVSTKEKSKAEQPPKEGKPPKAEKQAGAITTLPPAPASDTPEIPNEMEELREFTSDLDKNLREEAASERIGNIGIDQSEGKPEPEQTEPKPAAEESRPPMEFKHNPAPETTPGPEQPEVPAQEQKRRLWPWLVGGTVLIGGLAFAASALLKRRSGPEQPEPSAEQAPEPDPGAPVDPWDK